ncbi:MAG: hypothetical protein H6974_15570 [Gammaproteobacteria bacterium]|nr:hypothetical protein [Candidatus Competibacteraceae bacterium]MCP5198174.1 hypothetical protein [Gammaproteobacteria bacterium]
MIRWLSRNIPWVFSGAGIAIIAALLTWLNSTQDAPAQTSTAPPQQIIYGDHGIQAGRDVYIGQSAKEEEEGKEISENLLMKLSPDNIRAKSIRAAEHELELKNLVEEDANQRTFIKEGYRVSISDFIDDKSYQTISIGPVENSSLADLPKIKIGGAWGEFQNGFGSLTVGEVLDSYGGCEISDWNRGANGRCFNIFELQCAGSNAQNNLFLRAGVDSCYYSSAILDQADAVLGYAFGGSIDEIDKYEFLGKPKVRATKVNYIEVSEVKKKCPRAAGCD